MNKIETYHHLISLASLIALTGFALSGPVGLVMVNLLQPQPPWVSPALFAENYHFVQDMPYYFGFLLLAGMLMLAALHYLSVAGENVMTKIRLLLSVATAIIFCTLISFNYICQTTYVRNLALHYAPQFDSAIAMMSMSNPLSFCWANEMWGYAMLGISTWLGAAYYTGHNKNTLISRFMIANGMASVAGGILTVIDASWVLTPAGLGSYVGWNALMMAMMVLIHRHARLSARARKH